MVEFTVVDVTLKCETRPDLFSPKALDKGSEVLLQQLAKAEYSTALDWGCGWGAMALWLAKHQRKAQVWALDSDIGAIKAAEANKASNDLQNLTIVASHGYEDLGQQQFDLIISNPPTHRGREVVESMIAESQTRLASGGQLMIVVEARLKPWVQRALNQVFGDCTVVARSPKHVVLSATK